MESILNGHSTSSQTCNVNHLHGGQTTATTESDSASSRSSDKLPQVLLLIENPKKSTNWGPILRCAAAFGISQIVAVGYDKCSVQGSHGASKHVELVAFPTHDQAVHFLQETCHCECLVGLLGGQPDAYDSQGYSVAKDEESSVVNIVKETTTNNKGTILTTNFPKSFPLHANPFLVVGKSTSSLGSRLYRPVGNLCVVLGKKSKGLVASLADCCDLFCHVPYVGMGRANTEHEFALLNVEACLSILLHQFKAWAGYQDGALYMGQKYKVVRATKGLGEPNREEKNKQRRIEQEAEADTIIEIADSGSLFGHNNNNSNDGDY
jgi:tRNA G18 (ribose-2'-O)-methylase SpoU